MQHRILPPGLRERISLFALGTLATGALNIAWLILLALPISWLWNHTLVPLARAPAISYLQALGLLMLWFLLRISSLEITLKTRE